jgi:hypothetical protein
VPGQAFERVAASRSLEARRLDRGSRGSGQMYGNQRAALPAEVGAVRNPALEGAIDQQRTSVCGTILVFAWGPANGARQTQCDVLAGARPGCQPGNA